MEVFLTISTLGSGQWIAETVALLFAVVTIGVVETETVAYYIFMCFCVLLGLSFSYHAEAQLTYTASPLITGFGLLFWVVSGAVRFLWNYFLVRYS